MEKLLALKYTVPRDNALPKFTGDNAVINYKLSGQAFGKVKVTDFYVDNSYVTSEGVTKEITVSGDIGAKFDIFVKKKEK